MSKPTMSVFPIENGKLLTPLDCNNLQLLNLDESNLSGGPGPGGGNDTGTTTAILKGDGNHGFADAVIDVDYASPAAVALKEDVTTHDADIATIDATIASLTTDVGNKADSASTSAALALKTNLTTFNAYVASNDGIVAQKADTVDVDNALALKADTADLATKEDLLPTTANDGWILARHDDDAWYFVDPVTLGTTNQTFSDGQSNTDTSWNSDQANFTIDDVGLGITGTNIPASTTIASVTDENTIVLSQATTGTGTGLTFTILNRLSITPGTGTVTSVSVNNTITELFLTSVSNPTTTPTLGITTNPAVGANRFWGNPNNFSSTATFMSAAQSRTSLGGTTVGQALFQLANPSAISWARINADNTVTARTAAQTLGDLGAESALTFTSPLARSVNAVSIPAATISNGGYLTQADFITFTAKPPNSRFINTTSPLVGGGNLSADLTLSMPAATVSVAGYLTAAGFADFNSKPPSTRQIATTGPLTGGGDLSANRTIAMPAASASGAGYLSQADYNKFSSGAGNAVLINSLGGPVAINTTIPPITRVVIGLQLNQNFTITLPAASGYGATYNFPFIEIVDIVPGGSQSGTNFLITLNRVGSDSIDGVNSIVMAKGQTYLRLNSDGVNRWSSTKYYVDTFRDGTDATKQARIVFPTSPVVFPTNTIRNVSIAPSDNSVTVVPGNAPAGSVVRGISDSGTVVSSPLTATEIVPTEMSMGNIDTVVTNDGSVDTVKVTTALTATRSLTLPFATLYSSGEVIRVYDSTGNPNNQVLRVRGALNGAIQELINGNASIDINQGVGQSFNRIFVADPVNHRWSVEMIPGSAASGLSADTWHTVNAGSGLATLTCSTAVVENHHIVNMNVQNITLIMSGNISDGSTGRIRFFDSTGAHTVTVPAGTSRIPTAEATTAGKFTLSSGTNIEDEWGWDYNGTKFNFFPLGKNFAGAAAPSFAVVDVDKDTGLTTNATPSQGISDNFRYGLATKLVAAGGVAPGAFYTIGRIKLRLFRAGATATPAWNLRCAILADNGAAAPIAAPAGLIGSVSDPIVASTLNTGESLIDFNPNASVASGTTYWIVLYGDNATFDAASYVTWSGVNPTPNFPFYRSSEGLAWQNVISNTLLRYITYRNA